MRKPGEEIGRAKISEVVPEGELTLVILDPEIALKPIEPNSPASLAIASSMAPKEKTPEEKAAYKPQHSRPIRRISNVNRYDHL